MTQERALEVLKTGGNVFLTGEPGAGKTFVINQYIAWLEAAGLSVAVTASTGIAATHIGGMTIHSWSGVGARDQLTAYDLDQITSKEKVVRRAKKAHVLIIDEISMLDGHAVDMVDRLLRVMRESREPFGGLQVVFVGDFFQLPPVTRSGDMMRYAFESRAWDEARPLICYLSEQHRQEDTLLLSLLSALRRGEVEEEHYTLLGEQKEIAYEGIEPTRLHTHNADVDAVNATQLRALSSAARKFSMDMQGSKPLLEGLVRSCLSPQLLELKEDAMVMCTKNNFEAGYVNGTLGRVVSFASEGGYPVIETVEGRNITIKPTNWDMVEDGKVLASVSQVPLRLAWAITVHKSQGMSLDAAEIDLTRAFVYGQGYVALSRVRTLAGLKLLGLNPQALLVDPRVIARDVRFRDESEMVDEQFATMESQEIEKMHENFVTALGGTIPGDTTPVRTTTSMERVQKESTQMISKQLLDEGKSVVEVAKTRGLTEQTVWGHVETLLEKGVISVDYVRALLPKNIVWNELYRAVVEAIKVNGAEKLKPLYEATGEQYDYYLIRLARACSMSDK